MLDKLTGYRVHYYLHILGLFILAFGVPLNQVLMSIGSIWCVSNLLLEADFKTYYSNLKKSKIFWFVLMFSLLHFVGLLYTDDFAFAGHDLMIKLPWFAIPMAYIAKPVTSNEIKWVHLVFCGSLILTSFINYFSYTSVIDSGNYNDIRNMSQFGSHIRYSLMIALGAGIALVNCIKRKPLFFLWALLFAWFSFYTLKSQVLGGVLAYGVMIFGLLIYSVAQLKIKWLKYATFSFLIAAIATTGVLLYNYLKPEEIVMDWESLELTTPNGNEYIHDYTWISFENNYPVMLYNCELELRQAWNKKSKLDYDGLDLAGNKLNGTILRYMTSKGYRKDATDFKKLSTEEIHLIEQGVPSVAYKEPGVFYRLHSLKSQILKYKYGGNPSGNTLLQRFEHWRAGIEIISNNYLFGVGTGDLDLAFEKAYKVIDTKLEPSYRHRAHNYFLTAWISFGILGLISFTLIWIIFLKNAINKSNLFALIFALIAVASFLPEDTIETQKGVTFISLFLGLYAGNFLLLKKENKA